jgi:hypothetical protein
MLCVCVLGGGGGGTEILDFGYPQTSETDTLKQYISQEEIRSDKLQVPYLPSLSRTHMRTVRESVKRRKRTVISGCVRATKTLPQPRAFVGGPSPHTLTFSPFSFSLSL